MKRIFALVAVFMAAALVAGCGSNPPKGLESSVGQTFYTQHNFWTYRNEHETVNYGVDRLIPVNTQVTVNDIGGEVVEFTLANSGLELVLINTEKYTMKGMTGIFKRYFGREKVSLNRFSAAERDAIEMGKIEKGMSKEAVLMARGYPPAHETPSTDADQWKYWRSRFDTMIVYFENGKVSRIVD